MSLTGRSALNVLVLESIDRELGELCSHRRRNQPWHLKPVYPRRPNPSVTSCKGSTQCSQLRLDKSVSEPSLGSKKDSAGSSPLEIHAQISMLWNSVEFAREGKCQLMISRTPMVFYIFHSIDCLCVAPSPTFPWFLCLFPSSIDKLPYTPGTS